MKGRTLRYIKEVDKAGTIVLPLLLTDLEGQHDDETKVKNFTAMITFEEENKPGKWLMLLIEG